MFSFPSADQADIVAGKFNKFLMFKSRDENLVNALENLLAELKFKKYEDVDGWKKWSDPTGKISRKIFDK